MPSCCMLSCYVTLWYMFGFHICEKDYLCFPYAGKIKGLNELIIWLPLPFCVLAHSTSAHLILPFVTFEFANWLQYTYFFVSLLDKVLKKKSCGCFAWLLRPAWHCLGKGKKKRNMTWSFIFQVCHAAFNELHLSSAGGRDVACRGVWDGPGWNVQHLPMRWIHWKVGVLPCRRGARINRHLITQWCSIKQFVCSIDIE